MDMYPSFEGKDSGGEGKSGRRVAGVQALLRPQAGGLIPSGDEISSRETSM
jgi:hypothetical protein